jgi:hypothetical protein
MTSVVLVSAAYHQPMPDSILNRIPVVAGLAYIEHVRRLPSPFTATLRTEPGNTYFRQAIAVLAGDVKVGYLAPELCRGYYEAIQSSAVPVTCPGRHAPHSDHESSGIEVLLDFSALPLPLFSA